MRITRRQAQTTLGLLWLLDGALQLQPFMFTTGFAHQIIAPAADHQPAFVAGPVHWAAHLIATAPVALDILFAATQILLGSALLLVRSRRWTRLALAASLAWALSVWWLGEGLGGLAGLHTLMLTGAPGAVLLYAVIAVAVWPTSPPTGGTLHGDHRSDASRRTEDLHTRWVVGSWAVLWVGAAVLQALPGNSALKAVSASADTAPAWLQPAGRHIVSALTGADTATTVALVIVQALIGLGALCPRWRQSTAGAAIALSLIFWVLGQSVGGLTTGQATDPNAAPLYVLLALLLASTSARPAHNPHRPRAGIRPAPEAPMVSGRSTHEQPPARPAEATNGLLGDGRSSTLCSWAVLHLPVHGDRRWVLSSVRSLAAAVARVRSEATEVDEACLG